MIEVLPGSGLILEIPESELAVGPHRDALDGNAGSGVSAHITVLFPFMPPVQIDASVLSQLGQLFARARPFQFRLTELGWFDHDVLWLGPKDPAPFRASTELVCRTFPGFPPFADEFSEVVPHLTIAHGCNLGEMQAAERAVEEALPINACARQVTLMAKVEPGGRWTRAARFPLGVSA